MHNKPTSDAHFIPEDFSLTSILESPIGGLLQTQSDVPLSLPLVSLTTFLKCVDNMKLETAACFICGSVSIQGLGHLECNLLYKAF